MESLRCDLFGPGMTPLHRAGLGGLVSTLRWIERSVPSEERPRGHWEIDERSLSFEWQTRSEARTFFDKLFELAFQIREGLIYLPGQYQELPPGLEVRASLHEGLLLSFYDHGPKSRGSEAPVERAYEVDDKTISYRAIPLSWYKHQKDGSRLAFKAFNGHVGLTRTLFPGATKRHASHSASEMSQSGSLALPILFAPVGVVALRAGGKRVNDRGRRQFKRGAALLVPDLTSLTQIQDFLPALLPKSARDCQIVNVADAALQAGLRLRSRGLLFHEALSSLRCIWCCPTDWNSRLQPPTMVFDIATTDADATLDQFNIAMQVLSDPSPRLNKKGEYFWPRSHIRPLIAENLASGQSWFLGFSRLMTAQDPVSNNPIRNYLHLERKGLFAMTQEISWDHPGEETIVRAVHEAMRCRYGRIAAENTTNPTAMKRRMKREYERLRLALVGAKTPDSLRHALADLWSRAGSNSILREEWPRILPLFNSGRWQLTRDLALVALASYQGKEQEKVDLTNIDGTEEMEAE